MKKLIYVTIGGNQNYIDLLKLFLSSLRKFGNLNDDVDLLIITNEVFKDIILKNNILSDFRCDFLITNANSIFESASNRVKLFQYEKINKYDLFLYLDLDILILNDINKIFDFCIDDEFYVNQIYDGFLSSESCNIDFTKDEINYINQNKINTISSSVLLFNKTNLDGLRIIQEKIISFNGKIPICLEQPFICSYLFRNKPNYKNIGPIKGKDEKFLIDNDGAHHCIIPEKNVIIYHFAGGPGNWANKLKTMSSIFEKIIK